MSSALPKVYTALSALAGGRVYPDILPQNVTLPAITFFRVSGRHEVSMGGSSGLDNLRVQVDCWASSRSDADTLAESVRTAMFAATTFSVGGVDGPMDTYEDDTLIYRTSMDFSVWNVS